MITAKVIPMLFENDLQSWSFNSNMIIFPPKNGVNMFFMNDQHLPSGYLT